MAVGHWVTLPKVPTYLFGAKRRPRSAILHT
jgi:hypothetical protein